MTYKSETGTYATPWEEASIKQNERWLKSFILAQTGDPHATDDIVQKTLMTAWNKRETFRTGEEFGAWLRGIAKNILKQHYAKNRPLALSPEVLEALDDAAQQIEPISICTDDDRLDHLKSCLKGLKDQYQAVFNLRYYHQLSSKEIAKKLRITFQKVDVIHFRAKKSILSCVQKKMAGTN